MMRSARFGLWLAVACLLPYVTGCSHLQARDQLNKGVQAYKGAKYEEAIQHFQKATQLDPTLNMAKLYLATAYAQQVVAGVDTPENLNYANQAITGYKSVLEDKPNDLGSMKGIASLYFNTKKLDDARDWQKKVLDVDPKDAEAAYTIGVIDWTQAHVNALKALSPATDDGAGNPKMSKETCETIKKQNTGLVDEGLKNLLQAVDNRPNYDDAMAYLNLIYRRKADLDCPDDAARKADVAKADEWRDKAMGARKANEEKKNNQPGGIVMDASGNMK